MKKPQVFRPAVQPLEERVVLSFSFKSMLHSILPFIDFDDDEKKPARKPAAQVSSVARRPVEGTDRALYAGPRGRAPANSTAFDLSGKKVQSPDAARAHPKVVPMYGPFARRAALAALVARRGGGPAGR